jgi:signal transduction histidine kinase
LSIESGLRALAASGAVGLCAWTFDRDGARITEADDAFLALVGHTRATFTHAAALDWRALTPPDWMPRVEERFAALLDAGGHGPREQELLTRTGDRVPVLVTSVIVDRASGTAMSLCVDLTEQVRARVDAERANQAKSRFLAVMTHELRTPLNTIVGQTELMADGAYGAISDPQRGALARLRGAGRQLRGLIDDVLTFSRLETGVEQYVVTEVVLSEALANVAPAVEGQVAAKAISFALHRPQPTLRVYADHAKLDQVLLALLSNAVKFTPSGGQITLDTAERPNVHDYVFVRVSDTGSGVARARQEAIFEPFTQMDEGTTRRATGLGLGLTISRDLARGMGGDLRVRSTEGGGSTFTLSLRRAAAIVRPI